MFTTPPPNFPFQEIEEGRKTASRGASAMAGASLGAGLAKHSVTPALDLPGSYLLCMALLRRLGTLYAALMVRAGVYYGAEEAEAVYNAHHSAAIDDEDARNSSTHQLIGDELDPRKKYEPGGRMNSRRSCSSFTSSILKSLGRGSVSNRVNEEDGGERPRIHLATPAAIGGTGT